MKLFAVVVGLALCHCVLSTPLVKRAVDDCGCLHDGTTYQYAIGDYWDEDCVFYHCASHENVTVTYKCKSGDSLDPTKCYDVSDVWEVTYPSSGAEVCMTYRCYQPPAPYQVYATIDDLGCRVDGACYGHGGTWPSPDNACVTYMCSVDMDTLGVSSSYTSSCSSNNPNDPAGTCYNVGDSWSFDVAYGTGGYCVGYTCTQQPGYVASPSLSDLDCRWNSQCYDVDSTWDAPDCLEYTCIYNSSTGSIGPQSAYRGCWTGGVCHGDTDTWSQCSFNAVPNANSGSCRYYQCDLIGNQYETQQTSAACRLDGVDYAMGSWQLYDADTCLYVTCDFNGEGGIQTSFDYQCKDCDGVCHEYGTSGWPYILAGVRSEDCTCTDGGSGKANDYTCN